MTLDGLGLASDVLVWKAVPAPGGGLQTL